MTQPGFELGLQVLRVGCATNLAKSSPFFGIFFYQNFSKYFFGLMINLFRYIFVFLFFFGIFFCIIFSGGFFDGEKGEFEDGPGWVITFGITG